MDAGELELHGIVVHDQQPPSPPSAGGGLPLRKIDADRIDKPAGLDRFDEQRRESTLVGLQVFETAQEARQRQNWQLGSARRRTQASEQFATVHVGENQVLEEEGGRRMF